MGGEKSSAAVVLGLALAFSFERAPLRRKEGGREERGALTLLRAGLGKPGRRRGDKGRENRRDVGP